MYKIILLSILLIGIMSCDNPSTGINSNADVSDEIVYKDLKGTVVDCITYEIFSNAKVKIKNDKYTYETVTDSTGLFHFTDIAAGNYTVFTELVWQGVTFKDSLEDFSTDDAFSKFALCKVSSSIVGNILHEMHSANNYSNEVSIIGTDIKRVVASRTDFMINGIMPGDREFLIINGSATSPDYIWSINLKPGGILPIGIFVPSIFDTVRYNYNDYVSVNEYNGEDIVFINDIYYYAIDKSLFSYNPATETKTEIYNDDNWANFSICTDHDDKIFISGSYRDNSATFERKCCVYSISESAVTETIEFDFINYSTELSYSILHNSLIQIYGETIRVYDVSSGAANTTSFDYPGYHSDCDFYVCENNNVILWQDGLFNIYNSIDDMTIIKSFKIINPHDPDKRLNGDVKIVELDGYLYLVSHNCFRRLYFDE